MVKMKHKGLLVIGMTMPEINALRDGYPIPIPLDDVGLEGQQILIMPGPDNQYHVGALNRVADAYENGATSALEIAKILPKMKRPN